MEKVGEDVIYLPGEGQYYYPPRNPDASAAAYYYNSMPSLPEGGSQRRHSAKYACHSCTTYLQRKIPEFDSITHKGPRLKQLQSRKRSTKSGQHFRDIKAQNLWLEQHLFSLTGELLVCPKCVSYLLGVGGNRLKRVRISKLFKLRGSRKLKKSEIIHLKFEKYIVYPSHITDESEQKEWFAMLENDYLVGIQTNELIHGNAGNKCASKHPATLSQFLSFIDNNRVPVEGAEGEYNFTASFKRLNMPREGDEDYVEKMKVSPIGLFNLQQVENGYQTISNGTGKSWLKKHRPHTTIYKPSF